MIRMFGKKQDSHEFKPLLVEIEDDPLNPLGRSVFWIIVLALLFFGVWMMVGKVDVVVSARGKVTPLGEVKTVQPLNTGVVRSIFVKPGDLVAEGQVMMEIDPSDINPELESMQTNWNQVELEILCLEALLTDQVFSPNNERYEKTLVADQANIYQSAKALLEKQIRVKTEELAQVDERLAAERKKHGQIDYLYELGRERYRRLKKVQDLISRDEIEKAEADFKNYENQLRTTAHGIEELLVTQSRIKKEIELIKEDERSRLLNELAEKRQHRHYLKARIRKAEFLSQRQQIRSPVRGYVAQLFVHTIGGVVTPAEKLAHVVPADSSLVIKALIQNKDIGFITAGMDASIKVDAFNFQKYGIIEGRVRQVSKDSIEDEHLGLVYEAYIDPRKNCLTVEGAATPITTGMSVSAEIKVGKRRIIEFFIYPLIKYLDEGISVR